MPTEIDKDLQATLKQAKAGRPMQFAFLGKGTGGTLLAAKKIMPATIAEAKKEHGGSLFRGRLVGEDGHLVFEVAKEPPPVLTAQLKRTIKEHAGLTWDVTVRVKGDAEEEPKEEASDTAPPPPPPPGAGREQVMARLQALTPRVKAALTGPNAARVQALLGAANGLLKNNDFTQADKVLDELEPLVATAPPPPPGADAKAAVMKRLGGLSAAIKAALAGPNAARVQALFGAINGLMKNNDFTQAGKVLDELEPLVGAQGVPPSPPTDAKAAVMKRLGALTAAIKAALTGPNAGRVQALFGAINGLMKNNDFAQAGKVLDELEPLVGGAPPPPPPQAGKPGVPPPPPGQPPPGLSPEGVEFRKRLAAVQGPYMAALPKVADSAALRELMSAAAAAAKGGDFAQALALLGRLEETIKKAPRKDGEPVPQDVEEEEVEEEETPEVKKSFFALQKSRVLWAQTHGRMKEQLKQLERSILETCEQLNDDLEAEEEFDPDQLVTGTQRLNGILDKLDERLIDKLDEALNAADAGLRRKRQVEAKEIVKEYVAFVNSDPLMAVIDNNGFTDVKIADGVIAALKELSANL
ncbi:MAG TPA: hypothetical protein VFW33_21440 [Gemmataceae bacterium]|nr:hypothetical protein [Gemmataceae bacterium]